MRITLLFALCSVLVSCSGADTQHLRETSFSDYSSFEKCWRTFNGGPKDFKAKLRVYELTPGVRVVDPVSVRCKLVDPEFNPILAKFAVGFDAFDVRDPTLARLTGNSIQANRFSDISPVLLGEVVVTGTADWRKGPADYGIIIEPLSLSADHATLKST
jgi:hypothetical protein